MTTKPLTKPRLRGVSHEISCYLSALAGTYLVSQARGPGESSDALIGATIYSLCLFFLYAASALYHRPHWSPPARARMRRIDHLAIYLLIAGTTTPFALLSLQGAERRTLLLVLWLAALAGVAKTLLWKNAPKALSAVIYVLMGSLAAPFLSRVGEVVGPESVRLLFMGAVLYVVGAVVYAAKRPNPFPKTFGYHEIFHAFVIAASVCHFAAIFQLIKSIR